MHLKPLMTNEKMAFQRKTNNILTMQGTYEATLDEYVSLATRKEKTKQNQEQT